MLFESLPNELLILCFKYLNAPDVFYSLDHLNHRFDSLIRTMSLWLNFENVKSKFLCDQFGMKMSMEESIRRQIRSLRLSNKETCYPIHFFLSKFSILEFSQLRRLALVRITVGNWECLQSILPQLSALSSFQVLDCDSYRVNFTTVLPMSQLQTLVIPQSFKECFCTNQLARMIHLTIKECTLNVLLNLLKDAPNLSYLKIGRVCRSTPIEPVCCTSKLKSLIINLFYGNANNLWTLFQQTPNLEELIIETSDDPTFLDADVWESCIIDLLPHLTIFKFKFEASGLTSISEDMFMRFQNDFWCVQHAWLTEYMLDNRSGLVYTIPYPSEEYSIDITNGHRRVNGSIHTFDGVKKLDFQPSYCEKNNGYYFANVDSLEISDPYLPGTCFILVDYPDLGRLQMLVKFSNIKHLTVSDEIQFKTSNILKEIFESATQLSSLKISLGYLISLCDNDELCQYFSKFIRKLNLNSGSFRNSNQLKQFCKIFVNLEQLEY
ncbi:unnamed protein product, partial [Adineta ricciae]